MDYIQYIAEIINKRGYKQLHILNKNLEPQYCLRFESYKFVVCDIYLFYIDYACTTITKYDLRSLKAIDEWEYHDIKDIKYSEYKGGTLIIETKDSIFLFDMNFKLILRIFDSKYELILIYDRYLLIFKYCNLRYGQLIYYDIEYEIPPTKLSINKNIIKQQNMRIINNLLYLLIVKDFAYVHVVPINNIEELINALQISNKEYLTLYDTLYVRRDININERVIVSFYNLCFTNQNRLIHSFDNVVPLFPYNNFVLDSYTHNSYNNYFTRRDKCIIRSIILALMNKMNKIYLYDIIEKYINLKLN